MSDPSLGCDEEAMEEAAKGGDETNEAKLIADVLDAEEDVEMEEGAVAEVMKWLEEEMDGAPLPHSPSYRQEMSFVTINGNEESCGPSFSCSASTVMANVDTGGGFSGVPYFAGCPADWQSAGPLMRMLADRSAFRPMAESAKGCAAAVEKEDEIEWVAQVLGVGGDALGAEEGEL